MGDHPGPPLTIKLFSLSLCDEISNGRSNRPAEACHLSHHLMHGVDGGGMTQTGDGLHLLNGGAQLHADWGRA